MTTSIIRLVQLAVTTGLLEAVLLPDGRQGATIRSLCALLQIDTASQQHRIKRNRSLAAGLVLVDVDLPDGARALNVLLSNYIALFVVTLHVSRLAPQAQQTAQLLQTQAVEVIAGAFSQAEIATETPKPITVPAPAQSVTTSPFDKIMEGFSELKADYFSLEQRISVMEEANSSAPSASGAALSSHQVGQVFLRLRLLRERKGITIEEAEQQLAAAFHVAHLTDIDTSQWEALMARVHELFR